MEQAERQTLDSLAHHRHVYLVTQIDVELWTSVLLSEPTYRDLAGRYV